MARRRVDLRLDDDLLARVDAEAETLGQTRTKFVERALEKALADGARGEPGTATSTAHETEPASPRASKPKAPTNPELAGLRNVHETVTRGMGKGYVPPRPKGS